MTYTSGETLEIKVTPNAKRNDIVESDGVIKVYVTASPEDGKANKAVEKLFKKKKGIRISIISGHLSRIKRIQILD